MAACDDALIQRGSRFIPKTESRDAMIEPECLAIVWATAKSRVFLAGAEFEITTEDKPIRGTNSQQKQPRSKSRTPDFSYW